MTFKEVKSSWVAAVGYNPQTGDLCVGAKEGKHYLLRNYQDDHLRTLLERIQTGSGSIGNMISAMFKAAEVTEIDQAQAIDLSGGGHAGATAAPQQARQKNIFGFVDLLLPQARTGLFSFT